MTVYAPAEQQPKLGRRRDELTEVKVASLWGFLNSTSLNIVDRLLWRYPQDAFICIFLVLIVSAYKKELLF